MSVVTLLGTGLDRAIAQHPNRWDAPTVAMANAIREATPDGRQLQTDEWTEMLDEIAQDTARIRERISSSLRAGRSEVRLVAVPACDARVAKY